MKRRGHFRLLGTLALLTGAGCTWAHQFRLGDLEQLTPGETTRMDLDRLLGPHDFIVSAELRSSECDRILPPSPFCLLTWPLFLERHETVYRLNVLVDEKQVLRSASLDISEELSTSVLLFLGTTDWRVQLREDEIRTLRHLEEKGVEVRIDILPMRCFGGIIGWESVPLEEYLRAPP